MGLDMYLNKRTWVGNQYKKPGEIKKIHFHGVKSRRVSEIVEQVAYWRKANAIHKWFVDNTQDGDDDNGQESYVSREQLMELLDIVEKVLEASKLVKGKIKNGYTIKNGKEEPIMEDGKYIKNPKVAKKLLPTSSGFFFGSQEYDQYYYDDLVYTRKVLREIMKDKSDGDYYYRSSW